MSGEKQYDRLEELEHAKRNSPTLDHYLYWCDKVQKHNAEMILNNKTYPATTLAKGRGEG